jgi:predicted RNase H-like HicB family nuclease
VHWNIETEREYDGRWIAEIPAVPGVIVYGVTEDEAKEKACALAETVMS